MNTPTKLLIAACCLLSFVSARADGGFKITSGDYDVTVKTGSVTALALGSRAAADINVGGIQAQGTSVQLGRDYRVHLRTGSVGAFQWGWFGTGPINLGGIQSR